MQPPRGSSTISSTGSRWGQYADRIADSLPTGVGRQVEVARALTTEPRIILLDEPAAGQDPEETARLPTYFAVSWPAVWRFCSSNTTWNW